MTGMTSDEMDEAARQLLTSQPPAADAPQSSSTTATESDADSDDSWLPKNTRPNGNLREYEFSV